MGTLCSVDDVKQYIDTIGRWEDADVESAIAFIEEEIYDECNVIKSIYTDVNGDYSEYYLGERQVFKIDSIKYGDSGSQISLGTTSSTYYTKSLSKGMIVLNTTAINNHASVAWPQDYLEVEYVPGLFNKYCAARVAQHLLEKTQVATGKDIETSLIGINRIVDRLKQKIVNNIGPVLSSQNANYDYQYNINRIKINQDHDRNKDLVK